VIFQIVSTPPANITVHSQAVLTENCFTLGQKLAASGSPSCAIANHWLEQQPFEGYDYKPPRAYLIITSFTE
jgi:hypothetical protein